MNRLLVTLSISAVTIGFSIFSVISTVNTTEEIMEQIEVSQTEYEKGSIKKAQEHINFCVEQWENKKSWFETFLYHEILDEISISLKMTQQNLDLENDMFLTNCEMTKEQLHSLSHTQLPLIENIL